MDHSDRVHIVKVQRPIVTNDYRQPWLIYAQGRKKMREVPQFRIPQRVKDAMGEDLKGYFRASWVEPHGWTIHERVEEQEF